jgi:hypothetical protein
MNSEEFLTQILERMTASITTSAVQRQGPKGTKQAVQDFLSSSGLITEFSKVGDAQSFVDLLNRKTLDLQKALPVDKGNGGYWGTARKCLNIFLFECSLNRHLYKHYNLATLEDWLEVPLDSLVGTELKKDAQELLGRQIPAWNTIKGLTKETSDIFQAAASDVAARYGSHRAELDLRYWRRVQEATNS